jgi:hypothetical protein
VQRADDLAGLVKLLVAADFAAVLLSASCAARGQPLRADELPSRAPNSVVTGVPLLERTANAAEADRASTIRWALGIALARTSASTPVERGVPQREDIACCFYAELGSAAWAIHGTVFDVVRPVT